jgi:hypothetical protein
MTTPKLPGQSPTPDQELIIQQAADYWRSVGNESPVQGIARVEDAAKQLIGLTTALQGLYFAVFAFSDLRTQVSALTLPVPGSLILLAFFVPIVFWLVSLYCATCVFVPKLHSGINLNDFSIGAWQHIKGKYEEALEQKARWLHRSHLILVASFGIVLILLVVLALIPFPSSHQPTPIIIVTPTPPIYMTPTP